MLSVDDAYGFLCERGLLGPAAAIDGDLEITSSTRRNRNIIAKSRNHGSYLIKQPEADSGEATKTVRCEIRFYHFCMEHAAPAVRTLLPRLAYDDPQAAILGLELVPDSVQLWRHYESCAGGPFPGAAAYAVGAALARIHDDFSRPDLVEAARAAGFPDEPPAVLGLARPRPSSRATMSPGSLELIRRAQQEEGLVETLAQIADTWQATALIHGDIKLDNILLQGAKDGDADAAPAVYFVDWELAQIGDPAWDVGGALRDFIFFWVISMPAGLAAEEMADQARFPLNHLQPAIAALWLGYCEAAAAPATEAETLLERAIGLSAIRMIQTALDMAGGLPDVPALADLLLRVAVNLLADPGRARCDLFGLPAAGPE